MKMAVESMEMAPGAIPHPIRVPEHRLLSPKLRLQWRRRCGTFRGSRLDDLGFSRRRHFIGGRAMLEGSRGAHTTRWHGQGCATLWCGCLMALFRLCFGLRLHVGKIGSLAFTSSNSENIPYITFLKYKNSRKQEPASWHLVNRLVPENA
jgi:hypothetical protein